MASPQQFSSDLLLKATQIVQLMEDMATINSRISEDPTLIDATAEVLKKDRPDLSATDLENFNAALTQLVFTYNSGSPTQRSYIYKLL